MTPDAHPRSRFRHLARACASAAMLATVRGCSPRACEGLCDVSDPALVVFPCTPALAAVTRTGACDDGDTRAAPFLTTDASGNPTLLVTSTRAGTCHLSMTFASGEVFATDIDFAREDKGKDAPSACACTDVLTPHPTTVSVGAARDAAKICASGS